MSLITDVIAQARAIAADNNFRYRYSWEGNGAGAVSVPYTLDCCTFISYAIYLAQGWTWYNQPYSYYWPHITEAGFDYFLTNVLECTKIAYTSSYTPEAGDIIITDETLHHTFMVTTPSTIIDANNYFGFGADSIAERPYPTYSTSTFAFIYKMPGTANILDRLTLADSTTGDGLKFDWNTSDLSCTVTGTAAYLRYNYLYKGLLSASPFEAGKKYSLRFSGSNVHLQGFFYSDNNAAVDYVTDFGFVTGRLLSGGTVNTDSNWRTIGDYIPIYPGEILIMESLNLTSNYTMYRGIYNNSKVQTEYRSLTSAPYRIYENTGSSLIYLKFSVSAAVSISNYKVYKLISRNLISTFDTTSDIDFTVPANCASLILRLYVAQGVTVNETVSPVFNLLDEDAETGTWPTITPVPSWNRHRRHRHELFY